MPKATPALLRLRQETGVKSGEWSARVESSQSHYLNVERRRVVGSPELFQRCASELTRALGRAVDVDDLMEDGDGRSRVRHATAGGSAAESTETSETAADQTGAEASERGAA